MTQAPRPGRKPWPERPPLPELERRRWLRLPAQLPDRTRRSKVAPRVLESRPVERGQCRQPRMEWQERAQRVRARARQVLRLRRREAGRLLLVAALRE
jgi:hypothetical protein